MNFKVGDIVKCIRCDHTKERIGKYFIVFSIIRPKHIILIVNSIDNRYPNQRINLFDYKFEKVSKQEYIILKLKGIIKSGVKYVE